MDEMQAKRVRDELKAAGVGAVGLHTPESKHLATILYPDEHIGGVVYGTYSGGLAWLIATDQRVLFVDKKPLFTSRDELTYDVVSGVQSTRAGLFTTVVLHTRICDYTIRYVNAKSARIFVKYIEKRRLKSGQYDQATSRYTPEGMPRPVPQKATDEALEFLKNHDTAVLSTVDRTGNVHGAVVYYLTDKNNLVYILTKSGTKKSRNIYSHSQVALTVHEPGTMKTAQLQGTAEPENDVAIIEKVISLIAKPRSYKNGKEHLPPVAKLRSGAFTIIKISPTNVSFHDYAKLD